MIRVLILCFLFSVLASCRSYKQRVDAVCEKHGLSELPSPLLTVQYYYGTQKVKDLLELKTKIDSADLASSRQVVLDTIAMDYKGNVVYEGPEERSIRPMMEMRFELSKDALFEELQKMKAYKGIRISGWAYNFKLYESNGHQIRGSSSFMDGGNSHFHSKTAVMERQSYIDGIFFFSMPFYASDYYSMEVNYSYFKGSEYRPNKKRRVSMERLGKGTFIFQEGVVREEAN